MANLIASASGNMASFWAPKQTAITSCKVYFSPRQEGSGDPSPENVRNITGWDGVNVTMRGENGEANYNVDWSSAGTLYGGYVDLVSGELYQDWEMVSGNWGDHITNEPDDTTGYYSTKFDFQNTIEVLHTASTYGVYTYSNVFNRVMWNNAEKTPEHYYGGNGNGYGNIYAFANYDTDLFVQFVTKLAEPVLVTTLTPQQLSSFIGRNNLWTNADRVEIEYEYVESTDMQLAKKKMVLTAPHISIASGSVATFETDMASKLKECKIYFKPVQAGEGDPSPENVRSISGRTTIDIHYTKTKVEWNQWLQPLTEEYWKPYNSNYIQVTFNDEVATSEWLTGKTGYVTSIKNNVETKQFIGQIWYVSYMIKQQNQSERSWGIEFCGGVQIRYIITTDADDTWHQCSAVNACQRGGSNYTYIANCSTRESNDIIGMITQTKAPILINLTQMFGAGNEPTKEEFESQCILNGIDLTTYQPYNEGTTREWITSVNPSISTTSISFPNNTTIYGGYMDLVNKELVQEYDICDLSTIDWIKDTNRTSIYYGYINGREQKSDIIMCDTYPVNNIYISSSIDGYISGSNDYGDNNIYIKDENFGDVSAEDMKAMVSGNCIYKLATPVTYQLTNESLRTLKGVNNIWTSAKDNLAVKFWTHYPYSKHMDVIWNQMVEGYMTNAGWGDRNTAESTTTFSDGTATVDLTNSTGSFHTMISKGNPSVQLGHVYYVRYDYNINISIANIGAEFAQGRQVTIPISDYVPNTWGSVSIIKQATKDGSGILYIPFIHSAQVTGKGLIAQIKNPFYIDLTLMFGEGNEPETTEEFETICMNNGIDFSKPYPKDNGTVLTWKI